MAGYELITTAPDPRTAVRAAGRRRAASGTATFEHGRRQQTGRSNTQTAESVAASRETHSWARGQLVDVPGAAYVAQAGRAAWTPGCSAWTRRRLAPAGSGVDTAGNLTI